MIVYTDALDEITTERLRGFFVGWPKPPTPETHLKILHGSSAIELAIDDETGNVVGFVNANSDGVMSAYIPLLEVLPEYQHRGIGSELLRRLLDRYADFYMIDLVCDEDRCSFYETLGMRRVNAMMIRRMDRQACADE